MVVRGTVRLCLSRLGHPVGAFGLHNLPKRLTQGRVVDAAFINPERGEKGIVEEPSGQVAGGFVGTRQVSDHGDRQLERVSAGGEFLAAALLVGLDADTVLAELVQAGADLGDAPNRCSTTPPVSGIPGLGAR